MESESAFPRVPSLSGSWASATSWGKNLVKVAEALGTSPYALMGTQAPRSDWTLTGCRA